MELPLISVVIPCRNERQFISKCLESILASDYPQDRLEVLVIDGMSEDGTAVVLAEYQQRYRQLRVLPNPRRITPVAFNIGIQHARGDLIMIMSAHATYDPDAIRKCAEYSRLYGADNVGGIWKIKPRDNNLVANAIVTALSTRFGVGGAIYRTTKDSRMRWVDTAAYGCYRREVFEKIGLYNEDLIHSQDIELNLRLKAAGGKTLLAPDVVINYSARSDLRSFWKHNFRNGLWAVMPFAYSTVMPVRWRHLVPLAFVASLIFSALLALVARPFAWVLLGIAVAYSFANLAATFQASRERRSLGLLFVLPAVYTVLHLAYGLGSFWGCLKLLATKHRKKILTLSWKQLTARESTSIGAAAEPSNQ